jgi:hypothetical protein
MRPDVVVCAFCHKAGYHASARACDVAPGRVLIPPDSPHTAQGRADRFTSALLHQASELLEALRRVWPR